MKAVEFAFWLQGHFELQDAAAPLTRAQAQKIYKKTETVAAGPGAAETEAQGFVSFAQGLLLAATQNSPVDAAALAFISDTLRARLNNLFSHAIDPTIQGDQQQLRRTHRPGGNDGGYEVLC